MRKNEADTYLCRTRRECDILLAALKEKMERMISTDVLIIGAGPGGLATAIVPLFTTVRGRRVFRDASGGCSGMRQVGQTGKALCTVEEVT